MPTTTSVNLRTVVHKTSTGMALAFPDVCLTPTPAGVPVPIPYPNLAFSSDTAAGTTTVSVDGNPVCVKGSCFSKSTGDEPGTTGGILSFTNMGKAEFLTYSFDVKFEGNNVCRLLDLMWNNIGSGLGNTPPTPELQPPDLVTLIDELNLDLHVLHVVFAYKHDDVVTCKPVAPRFDAGYSVSGPSAGSWDPPFRYTSGIHLGVAPGSYTLTFDPFDRGERPLKG